MMSEFRKNRELPNQSYQRIKKNVLSSKKNGGTSGVEEKELFVDPSFPPDKTSLTYVYSGDDRYEKMVFKRPPVISKNAVFAGVGGCWDATFPWKQFRKRRWFEAAVVVLSLSVKYLEKVIHGYRNCEQNYSSNDYIGAFIFNIWRFGEFVEAVVDDHLPVLDNKLMYCPANGNPPEFWGALLHKAYAKIMKTYETIECGNMLDAMTDLTGAICEFFNPDVNPPENIFHLLYKSSVNRSLMVCWRNEKRLTPSGFHCGNQQDEDSDETQTYPDDKRYLHIITATTKFPTTDGRMIEMVRLKCPFDKEPKWNGKYSDSDVVSWRSLNSDFKKKYRPFTNKEDDEYWMTLEDFRCNFGGLIICSQTDPFKPDGFNVERMYTRKKEAEFDHTGPNKDVHPISSSRRIRYFRGRRHSSTPNCYGPGMFRSRGIEKEEKKREIKVRENEKTVKFDSTYHNSVDCVVSNNISGRRYSIHTGSSENSNDVLHLLLNRKKSYDGSSTDWRYSDGSWNEKLKQTPNSAHYSYSDAAYQNTQFTDRDRLSSGNSNLSETGSAFSTSDISVHVLSNNSSEDLIRKTHSAPAPVTSSVFRRTSLSSTVSQFSQNNFFATKTDFFSSHGAWKQIITHKGCWTSQSSHSAYPRILIHLSKSDAVNEITPPSCHGKCHVIFSLLQDCRNGPKTTNSLLVQTGFCIYKCKNPERDEKRPLSKLSLIGQIESRGDTREVTSRFDLDKGSYFVVPYCLSKGHEGEFLLRVIGEKDPVANKTGCVS